MARGRGGRGATRYRGESLKGVIPDRPLDIREFRKSDGGLGGMDHFWREKKKGGRGNGDQFSALET